MLKGGLAELIKKNEIQKGDGIIVVLEDRSVAPVQFVSFEEGSGKTKEAEIRWIFLGEKVANATQGRDCPGYLESRVSRIFPIRTLEEAGKLIKLLLGFVLRTKDIADIFFGDGKQPPAPITKGL